MQVIESISIFYIILVFVVPIITLYLINHWVNKFIVIREEQNALLIKLIEKLESKENKL